MKTVNSTRGGVRKGAGRPKSKPTKLKRIACEYEPFVDQLIELIKLHESSGNVFCMQDLFNLSAIHSGSQMASIEAKPKPKQETNSDKPVTEIKYMCEYEAPRPPL